MTTADDLRACDALVLRKTPYAESSLVVATLTPTDGQLHFLARGARRTGKKRFPALDLFREVRIHYRPSRRSELHTARDIECLSVHDRIASRPTAFRLASWLARFCLRNSAPGMPSARLFAAMRGVFDRLTMAPDTAPAPLLIGVVVIFLEENGLLPDYGDVAARARIDEIARLACESGTAVPDYPSTAWQDMAAWAREVLCYSDVPVPDGWESVAGSGATATGREVRRPNS